MLCPVLIGRGAQRTAFAADLAAVRRRRGAAVAVVAGAGLGKSRLVRDLIASATEDGLAVLTGRAVPGSAPVPLRPLAEAVLRADLDIDDPRLAGFAAQLGRLRPGTEGGDPSPVLLGEAIVRLLRVAAGERGCLLVLEDLHWADPETLAVLEYLADAAADEPFLVVATSRDEPPAADALDRLRRRGALRLERLDALDDADRRAMVAACLDDAPLTPDVDEFVARHSDGVPFLVEELLAGLVASGTLERAAVGWRAVRAMTPAVPASLGESVRARLDRLGTDGRRVVGAAATLGRAFDWELLPGVAGLDGVAAVDAMRAAIAEQLVQVDGAGFRFRHALTREAVLADLLPPERREYSARALAGIRRAHPGLPGGWCELAAELAEAAGDHAAASDHLVESARRALRRGAYASAATTAERAAELGVDPTSAREVQVDALVQSGDAAAAERIGGPLLGELPDERRAAVHLLLARAAVSAGGTDRASAHVASARGSGLDSAELDAVAALVALDDERPGDAAALAQAALDKADRPAVECEALGVLGRLAPELLARIAIFERMRTLAEKHGLTTWRVHAVQEIALLRGTTEGAGALTAARAVVAEAGSLVTVAQLDLVLAEMAFGSFERVACRDSAERCVHASRRFGLATLPAALLWLAGAHALEDDEAGMTAVLAEATALDPDDRRITADSWGRVRATLCAVREDRAGLRVAVDTAMEHTRRAPLSRSLYLGTLIWALFRAAEDDDFGGAARAELARMPLAGIAPGQAVLRSVDAIALGRQGRGAEAERAYEDARRLVTGRPAGFFTGQLPDRLVAEAALRDGWGRPGDWLREIEAFHAANGYDRVARACRALMTAAGTPAPRRGRGDSVVPPGLRALGVTSRELDVLTLVHEGHGNREIATRLHLSPRTVEHHVTRLLRRTGTATRAELAGVAIR